MLIDRRADASSRRPGGLFLLPRTPGARFVSMQSGFVGYTTRPTNDLLTKRGLEYQAKLLKVLALSSRQTTPSLGRQIALVEQPGFAGLGDRV